ncbi:MAG: hypothetical protein A4E19_13360 [Nitrospira sp. SG-bin1]|nr:MAG: hypothetical protein A4E19_13360 [Nitrospira sp. SG-bin1]
MNLFRLVGYTLLVAVLTAPAVHADDPCLGDDEKKAAMAESAALQKAEQAGQLAALFVAYMKVVANECIDRYDKNAMGNAKANLSKLGRDLAKASEAKGALYSGEPVRADGQTSAFRYYEAIGDYHEANRVLLKAVQANPEDLRLFETAWNIDNGRNGPAEHNGSKQPFNSPPAFRQELAKVATATADRLMKAEEQDAHGLTGNIGNLSKATTQSLEKLGRAALWMKYLPGGDRPAKDRAEQRGDTILKRPDPTFTQGHAMRYYEFSGSPKAKDMAAQIKKKADASQRAMEKAGEGVKGMFSQKSEAEQKQFDKKKADLEKELGF